MVKLRPLALAAALLAACAGGGAAAPFDSAAPPSGRTGAAAEPVPLDAGFSTLRARFDADAARARLLVLASPT